MFCVLKVTQRKHGFREKVFGRFIKDEYNLSTIPVYKGAPFYLLDITIGERGIDWEKILFYVGKCALKLVTNCKIQIPTEMNIGLYKSNKLYNKMMKNTFIHILQNNINKKTLLTVSVLDTKGEYTDFIEKLTDYSLSLTIATNEKEKYHKTCENIKEDTGLCPVLTTDFVDNDVKINTDENTMTIRRNGEIINLSSGVDFKVPTIYENLLPDGVCDYVFYSALYELCGVFDFGECIFETLLVNNEKKHTRDIHFS
jgi:hypothetical protein